MELRQCVTALFKQWWLIVVSVTVALVFSYLAARATPRTFVAHTALTVLVIGLVLPGGARQALDLTALGSIPRAEVGDLPDKLVTIKRLRSPVAEAYRVLYTNLQSTATDCPLQTLIVTSPMRLEGKSVTAANLAVIIAQSGKRVILIDADLRHPNQHRIFEMNNSVGLVNALRQNCSPSEALQASPVENLRIMTSGPLPDRPSELLDPKRLRQVIDSLRELADVVVVDNVPVTVLADAKTLAMRSSGTLLVVDSSNTPRGFVQRGKDALNKVGAQLSGAEVDRFPASSEDYYYYRYYSERGPNLLSLTLDLPLRPFDQADSLLEPISSAAFEQAPRAERLDTRPFVPPGKSDSRPRVTPAALPAQAGSKPGVILLGIGVGVVLVAVLIVSLARQQEQKIGYQATRAAGIASTSTVEAAQSNQTATAIAKEGDIRRQTEVAQTRAVTMTALANTASTVAAATRQALGFSSCDTVELDVLQLPEITENATAIPALVQLTWRVRNKTTLANCMWGLAGQETKLLRAIEVSGLHDEVPATLKWIQENDYDLSLAVPLSAGEHALIWRLIPPALRSPRGPDLPAKVVVIAPTPTPRPTAIPVPTACPIETFQCNCVVECDPRGCDRVCEVCIRSKCD